jgi:AraC-like DNA-binding protein/quercetin dioxygenase-like cupin family protein
MPKRDIQGTAAKWQTSVLPKVVPTAQVPVVAVVLDLPGLAYMPPHVHDHGRLIHSVDGTIGVVCANQSWLLPPHRALWLPPGIQHEMSTRLPARMRSLDFVPPLAALLPREPFAISVSPLLRALMHRAVEIGTAYDEDRHHLALLKAIPHEILLSKRSQIAIPFTADRRLVKVCRSLLAGQDLKRPLDYWADSAGASRRTLERLFVSETGMTFVQWRQHALMHLAIGRLVSGASISQVCLDLDILSTSAFHRMFRQVFETTPARYLKELEIID